MPANEDVPTYRSNSGSVTAESGAAPEERAAALAFLQQLAAEISGGTVELPCFPNVVVRISEALMDPNTTSEQVVTVVGAEPRLAAKLLQTANSAAFNVGGKPVAELRSAITRIGQRLVQSIAISYAIQQMQHEESLRLISPQLAALWDRSIAVAAICQLVAERTKQHGDEAFLTGLLHGIGNLYIMSRAAARRTGTRIDRIWWEMMDGWQAPIGKALLEHWGFPEEMCEAVGEQNELDRRWRNDAGLAEILIVSLVLAEARRRPEPRQIPMQGISAFASIGLSLTDCEATLLRAERRIQLVHDALS